MSEHSMLLERRIEQLEAVIGSRSTEQNTETGALEGRLKALESQSTTPDNDMILSMLNELNPKTALTHNAATGIAPLLYRQQELLASAHEYRVVLEQLQLASQWINNNNNSSIETNITESSLFEPVREYPSGLDKLEDSLCDIQQRTTRLTTRLDHLLEHYETTMMTVSEKLLLLQENELFANP